VVAVTGGLLCAEWLFEVSTASTVYE